MNDSKAKTRGINHLGLSVLDLESSLRFFTELLGWTESGRDESYPRAAVSDGHVRLTLWQVDRSLDVRRFDRRANVGLHHLALEVASEQRLNELAAACQNRSDVTIEFLPELLGKGPRKHMMCLEPGESGSNSFAQAPEAPMNSAKIPPGHVGATAQALNLGVMP